MTVWAFPLSTMELSPHSLTAEFLAFWYSEFDWYAELSPYSHQPVLYPQKGTFDASPKAISERTSYYQARLAFHSLPQLIRWFCLTNRCGPPFDFRRTSSWPRQARLVSGLIHTAFGLHQATK